MILAEALANRADVQRLVEQMRGRLAQSALVQEDERPPEEPEELLREADRLLTELEDYIGRINRTNLETTLPDGTTLTAALAQRDVLGLRYGLLKSLVGTASNRTQRYGLAKIRVLPTVEVAPLRRRMDEVAQERRELDIAIQAVNWTTDLAE